MKLKTLFAIAVLALGIAGAVSASDGTAPTKLEYSAPVACYESVSGDLVCPRASPVASPVVIVSPEPDVIDSIVELPSTGSGEMAN